MKPKQETIYNPKEENPNKINLSYDDKEKIILTYGDDSVKKLELLNKSFSDLDSKLKNNHNLNYNERQKAILELKLARYFQNSNNIDADTLYDAIIETPKFLNNDKGSLHRLLEIHQQKTLEKIAENRKKKSEIVGKESFNPYEALFETDSGKYYMARLLNMSHLEEESDYMKNCVGTSDSYINRIKKGEIEILSFRNTPIFNKETNKLEGDTPIMTIEYNLKTKVIKQMKEMKERKEYVDKFLSKDDLFFDDFIEALGKLRKTKTNNGDTRDFSYINSSELQNISIKENHILTNKGEISIDDYNEKDKEQFILKAEEFKVDLNTTEELFEKACHVPGLNISFDSLNLAQQFLDGSIKEIKGNLDFYSFTSAKGLVLPKKIGGDLYFSSLTSAKGLVLPKKIGGDLYLQNITSTEGLMLPEKIGGYLNLHSLTSVKDLILPKEIGGDINLESLPELEKQKLREKYPEHADKI